MLYMISIRDKIIYIVNLFKEGRDLCEVKFEGQYVINLFID